MVSKVNVQGSGIRDIASLSWPIMLSMASYTVIDVTDTLMVGWLGTKELAAIGVATSVLFLLKAFFLGLFEGIKILTAQAMGSRDEKRAWSLGFNGFYLAFPLALILFSLSGFGANIFAVFGGPAEIQALALKYFNKAILASMFWFFSLALTNFLQGIGDTKTPMYINVFVCLLNIIIVPIFIYGLGPIPAMGVEGSAIATVIATATGTLLFVITFFRRSLDIKPIDFKAIKELLHIGWPLGLRWFCDVSGFTIFAALVARLGEDSLAANQIGIKLVSLAILPGWGIAEATTILVGHHFGGKRETAIRRTFFSGLKITFFMMSIFGLLFIFAKDLILSVLNLEENVLSLSINLIVVVSLFQLFEALQNTASLALSGVGDTRFPMLSSLFSTWLVMLPLAYFLGIVCEQGLLGMWWAGVAHLALLFILVACRFLRRTNTPICNAHEIELTKNSGPWSCTAGAKEPLSGALR
jgi:MATE family multidrug resistance protein